MANSIWHHCLETLGFAENSAAKRKPRDGRRFGMSSELLESRALLSASSVVAPDPAEVARSKMPFEAPNVAGDWTVTIPGLGDTTAVVTQSGAKVTATVTLPVLGNVELSGKFTKHNNHELSGMTRVDVPAVGKVKVAYSLEFPEESNPVSLMGEVKASGRSLPNPVQYTLTGAKQLTIAPAVANVVARKATYIEVAGSWTVTFTSNGTTSDPEDLQFSQSTNAGGKHVTGVVQGIGGNIIFKGNLKSNSDVLIGKISAVQLGKKGNVASGKFDIEFLNNAITFSGFGTVSKSSPAFAITGARVQG
jgi:hypothetical protein